ncbi:MAG: hypothetical protein AAFY06_08660 [Pseudomonadota bacterium]
MRSAILLVCGLISLPAYAESTGSIIDLDSIDPNRFEKQCENFLETHGDGLSGVNCATALDKIKSLGPFDGIQQAQILSVLVEQSREETINYQDLGAKLDTVVPGLLDELAHEGITLTAPNGSRQVSVGQRVVTGAKFVRP